MEETVAIIQARMGSTRLPEKVLMPIGAEPMLWHVHERTSRAATVDSVVVATSTESADDAIADFCAERDITCFRGSETDVLDRYYQAASQADAEAVVRITGDCPFLSPPVIDRIVRRYRETGTDYVSNTFEYTHPDGLDAEVFGFETLKRAQEEAKKETEREHVTPYIRSSDEFTTSNVENAVDLGRYEFTNEDTILRWTVDYPEDMEFVRAVYDRLTDRGHWVFDQESILELLAREPDLRTINNGR